MQYFYDALHLNQPYFYNLVPLFDTEPILNMSKFKSKLTAFSPSVLLAVDSGRFLYPYEAIKAEGWQDIIDEQIAAYGK